LCSCWPFDHSYRFHKKGNASQSLTHLPLGPDHPKSSMGKSRHTAKVRFDGLDVAAMVNELKRELLGRRIVNIYDGVSDSDAYLLKLDGDGKHMLFLDSGIRFHTTRHQALLQQEGMPSPFCSKLRKHLRGLRLERIVQLGNYDRVVNFVFGTGESRHSLILELYARGNIILTKADYTILALLRSHDYDQVSVKVGQIYPLTYATSAANTQAGLMRMSAEEALEWAKDELNEHAPKLDESKKKKASSVMPLKAFLLKPSSGVYHYGPSLLEHCILCASLNPEAKIGLETIDTVLSSEEWSRLIKALQEEGTSRINAVENDETPGYTVYRFKDKAPEESRADNDNKLGGGLAHVDKVLEEFQPHILKQHEGRPHIQYNSFSEAVDDFFAHLGGQKQSLRAEAAEAHAHQKLEKIRKDVQQRVETLQKEQEKLKEHAELIELHADDVDKALSVINSALDTGMDWEALEQLVEVEQTNRNPIALLIHKLQLEQDAMVLSLPTLCVTGEDGIGNVPHVNVTVSLQESAFGNARVMFAKYRAYKEKSVKTLEASTKALKAAEESAQRQLAEAQKKSKLTTTIQATRKPQWFEKFHWFITSDNYLVLGGKDAHQNETLVKRYLRAGDAYLHADVHGAASCILRAKRHRLSNGKTVSVPLSDQALREAGNFTICRSSAWGSKMVTSAWWVESHQVSKTAPSGEYLTVGSFMVRGKKNFLPPSQLEMGLAVLFRLGDDDSIARHKNDRRDFALIDAFGDDESAEPQVPQRSAKGDVTTNGDADDVNNMPLESNGAAPENGEVISIETDMNLGSRDEILPEAQDDGTRHEIPTSNLDGAIVSDETMAVAETKRKAKGLSVKERKLIKKYGSLEAAQKAAEERGIAEKASDVPDTRSVAVTGEAEVVTDLQGRTKRGKRGKVKKAARRYADQDEEDKELALMALHGGERRFRERTKSAPKPTSEIQALAGAETQALLVKNAADVAASLPEEVKIILAECVSVQSGTGEKVVRWDKFDADVIGEQLGSLQSLEQQLAATKRLLDLKLTSRVDNFSASLSGIIRTVKKFGHLQVKDNEETVEGGQRKTKAEKEKERDAWNQTLAAEGIVTEGDVDDDLVDDTVEVSKLTGVPVGEDSLLYAVPVCAPYQTLSKYKYRIKLTPGNLKRGKASKQCVEMLLRGDGEKSLPAERNRELVKRVGDNDWVQVMCSDVKISAPGITKTTKANKTAKKGVKNPQAF
jgi:predicted ribosome quality control (RQC) complex YloA/Tae2 family protein